MLYILNFYKVETIYENQKQKYKNPDSPTFMYDVIAFQVVAYSYLLFF